MAGGWWFAGKGSPCSGCLCLDRDNFLPARLEWAEIGVFCCVGEFCTGLALRSGLLGEFCTGGRLYGGLRVSNGKFQRQ